MLPWIIFAALFLAACGPLPEDEENARPRTSKEAQELLLYATGVKDARQKIEALLARNPRLINTTNDIGETALWRAATNLNPDPDFVRFLLDRGADPNVSGPKKGYVVLCGAVGSKPKELEIMRLLLDRGARVDSIDYYGRAPLTYAVWYNRKPAADLLLSRGAMPSLSEAAALGLLPRMEELLKANPKSADQPGALGETPLYWAAWRNQREAALLLLKYGADPHRQGSSGITPAQVAFDNGHKTLATLLENSG